MESLFNKILAEDETFSGIETAIDQLFPGLEVGKSEEE